MARDSIRIEIADRNCHYYRLKAAKLMVQGLFDDDDTTAESESRSTREPREEPFILAGHIPETSNETVRRTGLAWSAGIAFFGAIVFMLFLGWLVDLMIGSAPWGIVGGIVLGSIIGFMQFFRISSQIFGPNTSGPSEHPLLPGPNEVAERRDPFDNP